MLGGIDGGKEVLGGIECCGEVSLPLSLASLPRSGTRPWSSVRLSTLLRHMKARGMHGRLRLVCVDCDWFDGQGCGLTLYRPLYICRD